MLQISRVLTKALSDMADCTHAKPYYVAVCMRRVAHEVSMQIVLLLRARQIVSGQSEVIHPDVSIAGTRQLFDREREQLQFGFRRRQGRRIDPRLRLELLRQMRVAIYSEPVRTYFKETIERVLEPGHALLG